MSQREISRGSLFAAISEGIASQEHTARLQKLEIGLGFLGFYTLVSVGFTLTATLGGQLALGEALLSALFAGLTWHVFRRWQRAGREVAAEAALRGREIGR